MKQGISGAFKEKICKLNPKGKFPPDWWSDIPPIRPNAEERVGYPTQKPVNLIKRILLCSSKEDDVVLDAFCGCGTTLVASHHLKRRWLGIDISPTACRVIANRLQKHLGLVEGQHFFVRDLPKNEQELKQMHPLDFQNWAVTALGGISSGKGSDKGIDGKLYLVENKQDLFANINSFYPIQVKQREKVGRAEIDAFETAMRREKRNEGYVVAFSFSKGSFKEVERAYKEEGLNIHLITVQDLIKQAEDRLIEQQQ